MTNAHHPQDSIYTTTQKYKQQLNQPFKLGEKCGTAVNKVQVDTKVLDNVMVKGTEDNTGTNA